MRLDRATNSTAWIGSVCSHARRFTMDARGATAVEYAIVACGVAVAVVAAVIRLGSETNTLFTSVATLLN